jgi:hypothetical protein
MISSVISLSHYPSNPADIEATTLTIINFAKIPTFKLSDKLRESQETDFKTFQRFHSSGIIPRTK